MNVKKAINQALLDHEQTQAWLSEQTGVQSQTITRMKRVNNASIEAMEKLADAFDMKLSDFIKLGEQ